MIELRIRVAKSSRISVSDCSQTIMRLSLHPHASPTLFHATTDAVDGLALDDSGTSLYWTAYNQLTYEGHIAVKSVYAGVEEQPMILITDLHRPRAIALFNG